MDESLSSSVDILDKDYDEAIRNKGELDERVFLNEEDSLLNSGSSSGGSMSLSGVKVCLLCASHCSNAMRLFEVFPSLCVPWTKLV